MKRHYGPIRRIRTYSPSPGITTGMTAWFRSRDCFVRNGGSEDGRHASRGVISLSSFGTDVQLDSDIDRPQVQYFEWVAAQMAEGDRVILCNAEPHWIYAGIYGTRD